MLSGCLFVYGHRKLYWFYTPACFEIKGRFQGGGRSQPAGAQRVVLFSFWSLVSTAWSRPAPMSSEAALGLDSRGGCFARERVGTQGRGGQPLFHELLAGWGEH